MSDSPPALLRGRWYGGERSRATPVLVGLEPGTEGPTLALHPLAGGKTALRLAYREVQWPEAWSDARVPPRVVVDLGTHGSLEVDDAVGWRAALSAAGQRPSVVARMQTRWLFFLGMLLFAGAAVWAFYRWGTPWAAGQLTRVVPLSWERRVADEAMAQLDGRFLQPSRLSAERQAALRADFDALAARHRGPLQAYPGYQPQLRLMFRSGMPANAFALPGGTVVMTDKLVEAADALGQPEAARAAVLGVLAHEIGHVAHRHSTRLVVEQGVLNVGLGLALGDVSGIVSSGANLLVGLSYRRQHESQSDCYAARLMHEAALPVGPMADLLEAIDRGSGAKPQPTRTASGGLDWARTHPETGARAARLRQGVASACADASSR